MKVWRTSGESRTWLAPEVIQSSAMDCGPATLKCLLNGYYTPCEYGRLREACQTTVDGTSIDAIESTARLLGLEAEQVILPSSYLWRNEYKTLPATVVVRQADGATHFVVVWRRHGSWLQVMDPATGRYWIPIRRFKQSIYTHRIHVSSQDWLHWATGDDSVAVLQGRLRALGMSADTAKATLEKTTRQAQWHPMAALTAAINMLESLVGDGAVRAGKDTTRLLTGLLAHTEAEPVGACQCVPARYWTALPMQTDAAPVLEVRGAVLVRITGRAACSKSAPNTEPLTESLAPELKAAIQQKQAQPFIQLWRLVRMAGKHSPLVLTAVAGLAMGGVMLEALLFRGGFELAGMLTSEVQRAEAILAMLILMLLLWALEIPLLSETLRLGRQLETRMRLLLLQKLPNLNDRYLQSRPVSDMAERSHSLYLLRYLPELTMQIVRGMWELIFTLLGIGFIAMASLPLALSIAGYAMGLSILAQPAMRERDLRARSLAGSLQRFYLDALLGIVPVRTHAAERVMAREHENLLTQWARAAIRPVRLLMGLEAVRSAGCLVLTLSLLASHIKLHGMSGSLLLLVYWTLRLPAMSSRLAALVLQLPVQRNIALRLLEPLHTPQNTNDCAPGCIPGLIRAPCENSTPAAALQSGAPKSTGYAIELQNVHVVATGHALLRDVSLRIEPGEHVAIVGGSGAGKSSLLGLLLGWHTPVAGSVWVDGMPLCDKQLQLLRSATAWIDPGVQIWNRSLLDNLLFNPQPASTALLQQIIHKADLTHMIARAADGLQTVLGENGSRLSGGEGQRVRVARTLCQQHVRLALLDEPFRGLDRTHRRRHLMQVRQSWRAATMLCVTHDIHDTQCFNRVLVIEQGRVVEDGVPAELAAIASSKYRAMLEMDQLVEQSVWATTDWRRLWMDSGNLRETTPQYVNRQD